MKRILLIIAMLIPLAACSPTPDNFGFALPPGSVENGQLLFSDFKCYECHTFSDAEFNDDEWRLSIDGGVAVELGGEKDYEQTYGDLVTSIINPSHRIAQGYAQDEVTHEGVESKMAYYNSYMTVQELIDLVTFLETKYDLVSKPYTSYYPYTVAPL